MVSLAPFLVLDLLPLLGPLAVLRHAAAIARHDESEHFLVDECERYKQFLVAPSPPSSGCAQPVYDPAAWGFGVKA